MTHQIDTKESEEAAALWGYRLHQQVNGRLVAEQGLICPVCLNRVAAASIHECSICNVACCNYCLNRCKDDCDCAMKLCDFCYDNRKYKICKDCDQSLCCVSADGYCYGCHPVKCDNCEKLYKRSYNWNLREIVSLPKRIIRLCFECISKTKNEK